MADEYIDKVEVGAKIQMMYIRREMDYGGENDFCRGMRKALRVIENMPAADVQPIKHGRWESSQRTIETGTVYCSNCAIEYYISDLQTVGDCNGIVHYCPNCGAKMTNE